VEDILGRSLRILVLLREAEPEALSLYEIMSRIGLEYRSVVPFIEGLSSWGLVEVEETFEGKRPVHLHRLTRSGRDVADNAIKTEASAKRHRDSHKKATSERA